MKKRVFIIFTMLLLSLCFISCKSCKKDKEVTPDIPAFDKLVSAIYDSETKLISYNENIKMTEIQNKIRKKEHDLVNAEKKLEKSKIRDGVYAIVSKHNGGKKNPTSIDNVEVCAKITAEIKKKYKESK